MEPVGPKGVVGVTAMPAASRAAAAGPGQGWGAASRPFEMRAQGQWELPAATRALPSYVDGGMLLEDKCKPGGWVPG